MRRYLVAAAALFAVSGVAFADSSCCAPAAEEGKAVEVAVLVCPVMKKPVASAEKASGKSVYNGKTYYFCCKGCKPAFDKDPAKYVGSDTPAEPDTKKS